jgi:hypothetical protein
VTAGYRLPLTDIRRLGRMQADYEAGLLGASESGGSGGRGDSELSQFVLLEKFQHPDGALDPDPDGTAPESQPYLRRFLVAKGLLLKPKASLIQVLRISPRASIGQTFRLNYAGQATGDLPASITAADLITELVKLPGLKDKIEVLGQGTTFGTDDTPYAARQWHLQITIDDTAQSVQGLSVSPLNTMVRLFQDWWWPQDAVRTIWMGLPTQMPQAAGAFVWAKPFPTFGWTLIHGECLTEWED